jgi:hypothetical protein
VFDILIRSVCSVNHHVVGDSSVRSALNYRALRWASQQFRQ